MDGAKSRGVVVTGGGSGIGLAAAKKFLEAGDRVVISGRGGPRLKTALEALSLIHGSNGRIWAVQADLSTQNGAEALAQQALSHLGKVDILVNNAGLNLKERSVAELSTDRWREVLGGNLDSAFLTTQAFLPRFRAQKDGLIVYINSIAGIRGNPLVGPPMWPQNLLCVGGQRLWPQRKRPTAYGSPLFFPGRSTPLSLKLDPTPFRRNTKLPSCNPKMWQAPFSLWGACQPEPSFRN